MPLRCLVKVNAINNLSDARYCAGMGVSLLGYALDPATPNNLDLQNFKEINEWVAGIQTVGEYGNADSQTILQTDQIYNTDCIEFARPQWVHDLQSIQKPLILTLNMDQDTASDLYSTMRHCEGLVEYYHLTSAGNIPPEHVISILKDLHGDHPVLLGAGFSPDNVLHFLDSYPLEGIALSGGDEIRPGFKDYDQLADILELLESDT